MSQKLSYKKFTLINRFFTFTKKRAANEDKKNYDEMTQLIFNDLNAKFSYYYKPEEKLCIDEGVIKSQQRYSFKCYFPNKPTKVGMKMYILCESKSSYVLNLKLYTGAKQKLEELITEMTQKYVNLNHKLYMDNFYTSFSLIKILEKLKIYVSGTLRLNRGGPKDIIQLKEKSKKHNFLTIQKEGITCFSWHDKKLVSIMNNFLDIDKNFTSPNNFNTVKSNIIKDYDQHMGGVDTFDQMLKSYFPERKSKMWTKKLGTYLMNVMIHNSYILFKKFHPNGRTTSSLNFRLGLCKHLLQIEDHTSMENIALETPALAHLIDELPNKQSKKCSWCTKHGKDSKTNFICSGCVNKKGQKTALHPKCFKAFHDDLMASQIAEDQETDSTSN